MPKAPIAKLLIVDDETAQMQALCNTLEAEGYSTTGLSSPTDALKVLHEQTFDLVLSDLMMPEMDGVTFLTGALQIDSSLVGIVMTGHGTIDTAVQAMQAGALDYILKPFKLTAILPVLARALAVRRLRLENVQLHEAVGIYKLSMALAFTFDLETVLDRVADAALLQSQVRDVSILVPAEDGEELRVAAARGEGAAQLVDTRIPFSQALSAWVERSRELLARSDKLPEIQTLSVAPLHEIPPSLSLAMLAGGKLAGILNFGSEHQRHLTGPGQSKALNILASAAASAIERASLIERLRRAEQRYRRLTDNASDIVFRYELLPRPRFTYVNPAVRSITGHSPDEFCEDPELGVKITHPDDRPMVEKVLRGGFPSGSSLTIRCTHKNGNAIWLEQRTMLVHDQEGLLVAVEGIVRDVTERNKAEEKIRRSLREKDVMLNEIHHRVKNNLQVVSSLLSLQADQIQDPAARHVFTDSQNRIQSMALIHQQLYVASNFAEIDFAVYLRTLANHLLASYASEGSSFTVSIDAPGASLSLAEAIPCGLIVNELISNSLKHSFQGRSAGEIRVGFGAADGVWRLTVDDDGLPLPGDVFANQPPTMGVRLVQALTSQLDGELHIGNEPKFRITFSDRRVGTQTRAAGR